MNDPYANMPAIERMESLLYGLHALDEHVREIDLEHARLVVQILQSELEQLITECKARDLELGGCSITGPNRGFFTVRLRLPTL